MTRIWLTAAVARIFEPGIKFDQVLILQGLEGTGKSTFFSVLGGRWFSDSLNNMDGKEGMEGNMGVWIHELSELGAMRKSDVEQVKSFVSKQTDRFRPAYGRVIETRPRECVFGASTNETKFLKGMDGNRRMWVIGIDPSKRAGEEEPRAWLEKRRDQIWAEAVWRWRNERPNLYLDKELNEASRARTREYSFDLSESIFTELESFGVGQLQPPGAQGLVQGGQGHVDCGCEAASRAMHQGVPDGVDGLQREGPRLQRAEPQDREISPAERGVGAK